MGMLYVARIIAVSVKLTLGTYKRCAKITRRHEMRIVAIIIVAQIACESVEKPYRNLRILHVYAVQTNLCRQLVKVHKVNLPETNV